MNREHPTGTERKSLNYECGWKGGDRGGLAARKKFAERKKLWKRAKKLLTGVGLLMEGFVCGNDASPRSICSLSPPSQPRILHDPKPRTVVCVNESSRTECFPLPQAKSRFPPRAR